jgi:hypothetical protein
MRRVAAGVIGFALLACIALDPYTWYRDASDAAVRAPWWQTALAGADALLIAGFAVHAWRSDYRAASLCLAAAIVVNLLTNAAYVSRDGVDRFLMGFGAEQYLSLYLGTIAIRALLLIWTCSCGRSA